MHFEAIRDVRFEVDGWPFSLTKGETVHTENSVKYGERDACLLLCAGGWTPVSEWTDEKEFFSLILARHEAALSAP